MKSILNALRAVANNISDDDFIMCVLAGVGPEYDSIVTNITLMPKIHHSQRYMACYSTKNI